MPIESIQLERKYVEGAVARYSVQGSIDTTLGRINVDGFYVHKVVKVLPDGEAEMEMSTDKMTWGIGNEKQTRPDTPARFIFDKYGSIKKQVGAGVEDKATSLNAFRYISYMGQKLELNKPIKINQKTPSGKPLYEGTQKLIELTPATATVESAFDVFVQEPKGKFKLKAKTVYNVATGLVQSTVLEMNDMPNDPARMSLMGANLTMTLVKP